MIFDNEKTKMFYRPRSKINQLVLLNITIHFCCILKIVIICVATFIDKKIQ